MEGKDEMKRIILIIMFLVLIVSLFGCAQKTKEESAPDSIIEDSPQEVKNLEKDEEYTELNTDSDVFENIDEALEYI